MTDNQSTNASADATTGDPANGIRRTVIVILCLICLMVTGFVWKINQPRAVRPQEMAANGFIFFDTPREILPFELTNHRDEVVTLEDFKGKWTMVFPGFTQCPDICPTTMATLATMWDLLDSKPKKDLQVMMFSVDPHRDTTEQLALYVPYFNETFIGVRGDLLTTANLAAQLNIAFTIIDPDTAPESYNVDHSSSIALINPRGQYQGFFRVPFDPPIMKLNYQSVWVQD